MVFTCVYLTESKFLVILDSLTVAKELTSVTGKKITTKVSFDDKLKISIVMYVFN